MTIDHKLLEGCGNSVAAATAHHATYSPVQYVHSIQTDLELYIVDWLSHHNHIEKWDQEIPGLNIIMHNISMSVDVPVCTSIEDMQIAMEEDP